MPLTLTIRNIPRLDNGSPLSLVLDQRGAIIGRAATSDWCLPDPSLHISSRHCEVRYSAGRYELLDTSTNGTFLHGQANRLAAAHVIAHGDVFVVGAFEIAASLDAASAAAAVQVNAAASEPEWKGWNAFGGQPAAAPPSSASAWDAVAPSSAISGTGPMSQSWAPPRSSAPAQDWGLPADASATPSTWDTGPKQAPVQPASEWSTPIGAPPPTTGDDIWGKFSQSNVVDWARGGFGSAASAAPQPLSSGFEAPSVPPPPASVPSAGGWGSPELEPRPPVSAQNATSPNPVTAPANTQPQAAQGAALATLLTAAGIDPSRIKLDDFAVLAQAGHLLRLTIAGLVVMLEARARAKAQMGAQSTNLEFDGNNPLKFARTPEQALGQLLNAPERGFMNSERAIEDAFKDLQAHQMATLKAMQGALRATLERFSPRAIESRAETGGLMSRIIPSARAAALWAAYEKEFGGVAIGSDEAFMDVFAKEFRQAYDELSAKR